MKTISKIYNEETHEVHQSIYDEKKDYFDKKAAENEACESEDSIWHAIMDPQ